MRVNKETREMKRAADQYRLQQARDLIASIVIQPTVFELGDNPQIAHVTFEPKEEPIPTFMAHVTSAEPGATAFDLVRRNNAWKKGRK